MCTKAIFISKRSYGYGETRNVFPYSVQKPLLTVQAVKLPRLKGVGISPRKETCVNWGGPIVMVPCLHQGNICIKRKLQECRHQKCIPLVGVKTPLTFAGCQTTPSQGSWYKPENGNLRKIGWTYRHGTVLAPRQYLYRKEATAMERPELYSPSRCKNPSYLCRLSNYPVSRVSEYGKEATGMEKTRNIFPLSFQKLLSPVQAVKLPRLKRVVIGPRTETCVHSDGPIAMVPYVHQGNIYIKKKLRVCRDQKCTPLVGAKTPLT